MQYFALPIVSLKGKKKPDVKSDMKNVEQLCCCIALIIFSSVLTFCSRIHENRQKA
jgi:hypothetical protein